MVSISAIIPAYNEEKTIAGVISPLLKVDLLDRVLVINDGSTDHTGKISLEMGVDVINLPSNTGKGGAISKGIICDNSDLLLFLDADLIGLQPSHIVALIKPLLTGYYGMSLGVFSGGRITTDIAQKITPFLSGQRGIRRDLIQNISNIDITRYGVELAITNYINQESIPYRKVLLENLTHVTKEEKRGIIPGINERFRMYWDIVKVSSENHH